MNIMDMIKRDVKNITTAGSEFAVPLLFTAPTGETVTLNGLATKHRLQQDTDGQPVNGKNAHCSFSETALRTASPDYPLRTAGNTGEVNLQNHRVRWTDSANRVCDYVITEWYPDETVGLIVCILGDIA